MEDGRMKQDLLTARQVCDLTKTGYGRVIDRSTLHLTLSLSESDALCTQFSK